MGKNENPSVGFKIVGIIRTVFIYILAAGIIIAALIFAASKSPDKSILGYRWYTVLTGSMEPTYSVGDVVIVKVTDASHIAVDDVITFNPSSDSDAYLTHRVTEKIEDYEGTGVICFRTKGDANDAEDSFLIDEDRVIGSVSFSVPKMGYVIRFIQLRWYIVIPLVIMVFIFFKLLRVYFSCGGDGGDENDAGNAPEIRSTDEQPTTA